MGVKLTTPCNNKVAACARFTRFGEHGVERRAGHLETLDGIVEGEIAGRAMRFFSLRIAVTSCSFAKPTSV